MQFLWNEGLRGRDTKFDRKLRSTLGIRRSPWEHLETMNLLLKFWKVYIYIYILLDLWKGVSFHKAFLNAWLYREREREVTRVSLAFTWMLRLAHPSAPPFSNDQTTLLGRERCCCSAMRRPRKAVFPLKADIVLCVHDGGYSSLPAHDRPIINYQAVWPTIPVTRDM